MDLRLSFQTCSYEQGQASHRYASACLTALSSYFHGIFVAAAKRGNKGVSAGSVEGMFVCRWINCATQSTAKGNSAAFSFFFLIILRLTMIIFI